jgi:UDP-N-acetylmuramyl pentapeptide phosphotransferase/UDP-N-acetylglucosamine-1-phosphate transferase
MLYPAFLALAAFMVTLLGTRLLILSLRNRPVFLDKPNSRSSHTTPVPRVGGIAVVTTLLIYFVATDVHFALILGLLVLAGVSILDDLIGIHPAFRLVTHFSVVTAMLHILPLNLFEGILPSWLSTVLITIGWVWFINLYNFMDGIDGITASETISVTGGIILVLSFAESFGEGLGYHAIILMAAMIGFWWWNRYPAKIFLGDIGSISLGFIVGYFLISLAHRGYGSAAAILPAYYVMDATITLLKRIWERKKIWQAHREHFYQQATMHIQRHDWVARLVFGVNLLLIALAIFATIYPEINWLCVILAYAVSGIWLLTFARIHEIKHRLFK